MVSCRGQIKVEPRPDLSSLGVYSSFPTNMPDVFIWETPGLGNEYYLQQTRCSVISDAQEDENALAPGSPDGASSSHNLGQAHFIVKFDQHRSVLTVRVVKALNLSPLEKEWSKPCNPYVIIQLLPDYRHQLQSTVHKKTTNPRFDETFEFEVRNFEKKCTALCTRCERTYHQGDFITKN